MAGYLEWVAITALVVAVAALAVGLAEMRKRRQRQAAVRAGYEANQDFTISQWSAGLREAVYQPISESDLAHRFHRP